jgi:hypothetical protein
MWWSSSKKAGGQRNRESWSLSRPLLRLSDADVWTLGDAVEGTQILGATGSGKTTGSGQAIHQLARPTSKQTDERHGAGSSIAAGDEVRRIVLGAGRPMFSISGFEEDAEWPVLPEPTTPLSR